CAAKRRTGRQEPPRPADLVSLQGAVLIRLAASFTRLVSAVAHPDDRPPFFFLAALAIALRVFLSFASACLRSFRFLLAGAVPALSTSLAAMLNSEVMEPGTLSFAQASSPDGGVSKMQVTPSKPAFLASAGQVADVPLQVSSSSQVSVAARHTVPAA